MRILAVDPGTKSGIAHSNSVLCLLDFSALSRKKETRDQRLKKFRDHLDQFRDETDLIVYEEARCSRHIQALIVIAEFQAVIKLWATDNDIRSKGYTSSQIKKFACGKGTAKKEQMIAAAESRWGKMKSSDVADARWLLELATRDHCG